MHRRPLGRGRTLVVLAAVVMLVGCVLPWFTFAGDLPVTPYRAFDGSGILVFVAALAALALVALPYAAGDRPVAADRGLAYLLVALVALVGVVIWPIDLVGDYAAGLLPDRAPGWWIALGGLALFARATFDIFQEPARR